MNVLMVNIGYPPFIGGSQVYLHELARRLTQEGHRIQVHTTNAGEVEAIWHPKKRRLPEGTDVVDGIMVHRHRLRYLQPAPLAYYLLRRLMPTLSRSSLVSDDLLERLGRLCPATPDLGPALDGISERVDLVHAFTIPFESLLLEARDFARRRGVPLVVTPFLHTGPNGDGAVSQGYSMRHQLALLREADAVMAMTEVEAEFLTAQGVPAARVHVVGGGIDPEAVGGGDGRSALLRHKLRRPVVLFLGAVTYDKGAMHVLDAMRSLWHQRVPANLVIAGTVVDQFANYFRSLPPVELERCLLLGPVSEEEKRDLLAACDVLVLPSRVDSFGLVFLEAWAYRKPVIGAWAGGIPALVSHEQDGYLVQFGDVADLARRIRYLVTYTGDARQLGERGYEKLRERYTWDRVYTHISDVYHSVVPA
ncbi:MAG: glycosyltransferase family 4 protein [Chloroflexi bacterium]|nr:glycosyltransferase family 4 protein [Chloroflexota bacterium]